MLSKQQIENVVFESLVALNEEKKEGRKIPVSSETFLLGSGTLLDSLDFVVMVTSVEERLQALTGTEVQLGADLQSIEKGNPFRSVASLNEHIAAILRSGDSSG